MAIVEESGDGRVEPDPDVPPGTYPARTMASTSSSTASSLCFSEGAKPPSSPCPVACPFSLRTARRAWKHSLPARSASAKVGVPSGMNMNSWKSTEVWA